MHRCICAVIVKQTSRSIFIFLLLCIFSIWTYHIFLSKRNWLASRSSFAKDEWIEFTVNRWKKILRFNKNCANILKSPFSIGSVEIWAHKNKHTHASARTNSKNHYQCQSCDKSDQSINHKKNKMPVKNALYTTWILESFARKLLREKDRKLYNVNINRRRQTQR